ncbi:PREDICTED: tumor necrosis factor-like [Cyprinodon variegatus]|uniref:tumor necrosis factor-like n=1 Tax=Cyprinodon variegatus TaxID=28743 RepID=UPI000742A45F|nr:PREDICTED: tumor necrosis factor-like [Cyprinodon variegatus]
MERESKVLLEVDASMEADDPTTAKKFQKSRLSMALIALSLCLASGAAVFLFSSAPVTGEGQEESSFGDLRHKLRQISSTRAAIHLEGEYNESMKTSVMWKNKVDQGHSQGGLKLQNNEILIPHSGLYFVYSQASFLMSCSQDADDTNPLVHVSHTVQRWTKSMGSAYQTIMHSVRSVCQTTANNDSDRIGSWRSAIYMGAVFNLNKGDKLKTVMEERMLEALEDGHGDTFFGVFAL